ncbi:MAG: adenylate/guanylate cyclase domain-containing protein [Pedobacter sp.]
MLSPKTKRNISRVIPFGVLWLIFSLIYCILERGILGPVDFYPSTGNTYSFSRNILTIPISGLFMGFLTGILEIGYFNKWFIKKSFTKKIILKSLIYILIVLVFLSGTVFINALYTQETRSFGSFSSLLWAFFSDYALVGIMLYIASIIVLTQFYAEFSDSIGPGTLRNFFLGKYHHPVEEERIFMFLDMKSSTTIAQQLGHVRYFEMLREYFFDLSAEVINYGGIIYQYAGDEMIICWKLKDGLKNNNSIECFFAMKRALEEQKGKYREKFGLLPGFKAGLHFGMVTAGEIGSLKKEIIFTGDVLNTSARIQGLCNQFDADLLVSAEMVDIVELPSHYVVESVGAHLLKGRNSTMEIFAVYFQPSAGAICSNIDDNT